MKIERLTIEGFRCFGPDGVTIPFEPTVTALIGPNGSGKTAVFHALARLFGTSTAQRAVRKSDFHIAADDAEIADGAVLAIDCVLSFPELDEGEEEDAVPDVFQHMCATEEGAPLKARIRLQATWEDDATPEGTITEEVRWVRTLRDEYDWDECPRVQPVERAFVQLVYVPATRNAVDQVTGLLKSRLWRAAQWSERLAEVTLDAGNRLQAQFADEDPVEFVSERLERRWAEVRQADTHARPVLRLIENKIDALLRRAEFHFLPDHTEQPRRLEDLSDGQRSLFHIALTAATLEMERDALAANAEDSAFDQQRLKRTYLTLLAIEEPENSLSPFFLSKIMGQARSIGEMQGAQSMISSHSASILSRIEPEEVRHTRINLDTGASSVRALTLPPEGSEARSYIRLAVRSYPELYFARFVILAEGESEAIVLPRLAEAMGFPLDRSFVPIVPLGGRFVRYFWRLLNDLDIPFATLLDLDLGRAHGGAAVIAAIVGQLRRIGNDLSHNAAVLSEEIDPDNVADIDDAELLEEDQDHVWLKALQDENVFFSSPIDLDFVMLCKFDDEYMIARAGGRGPQTGERAAERAKDATLKTGGNPELYDDSWDSRFRWYPYLFLGESKPEAHLRALAGMSNRRLRSGAPPELKALLTRVRETLDQ
ncbi:AAA family ATPase [Sphingomonas daechungensis]|uniref:AAA family ATPase n=1 Tax=Sphingomonas daechungensis TaxID=1176646 RepID=A0ABX6T016_9SPHN|nr:AAA family ATPase [Sphingomonas daechungensis]QNP43177.1 AAA family ATPase [Sphingomonas daechungensis]